MGFSQMRLTTGVLVRESEIEFECTYRKTHFNVKCKYNPFEGDADTMRRWLSLSPILSAQDQFGLMRATMASNVDVCIITQTAVQYNTNWTLKVSQRQFSLQGNCPALHQTAYCWSTLCSSGLFNTIPPVHSCCPLSNMLSQAVQNRLSLCKYRGETLRRADSLLKNE